MRCARTRNTEPYSPKSSGSTRLRHWSSSNAESSNTTRRLLLAEPAGRPLRGYRLGERLGIGREGTVYAARLPGVERDFAIRVYRDGVADQPDFVRTFEADAQRVASISHDAIVPIHDYWREPGGCVLVMRRMTGGTLRDRLQHGPLRSRGSDGARHAHRRRPRSRRGRRRLPRPARSRVRALRRPRSRVPVRFHRWAHRCATRIETRRDFAMLVAACLTEVGAAPGPHDGVPAPLRDLLTDDRPSIGDIVTAALRGRDRRGRRRRTASTNPYKGLRAFDEPDAADFFGRDAHRRRAARTSRVTTIYAGASFVVVGASGSGKSSIVRAGLLPRVRAGEIARFGRRGS